MASQASIGSLLAADLFEIKGMVAVITGGATGLGLIMAKALEANGAKVYIIGRRQTSLDVAAKQAKHGNIIPIAGDVTSKTDLQRIVAHIEKETGFVNLLIANAGISGPSKGDVEWFGPKQSSVDEMQNALWSTHMDEFDQVLDINVKGVYLTVSAFLCLLDAGNKKGNVASKSQVIGVASVAAFMRNTPVNPVYNLSKIAVTHLMKMFSTFFAKHHIRFNSICPGYYPSEMTAGLVEMVKGMTEEEKISYLSPLGRMGTEEDLAGVVLWLASRAGGFVNGNTVITDGGALGVLPSTY